MSNTATTENESLKKGKLVLLLKTFSGKEIRDFEKFVHSPYHNNRSVVTGFFMEIKKYFPGFDKNDLTKKIIYSKLFPETGYRDDVMRRLQSYLFKLGETFIAHKALEQNKFEFKKNVLDYYYMNFADSLYNKKYKDVARSTQEQVARSSKYYNRTFLLEEINRSFKAKSNPTRKGINLQNEIDSFQKYSFIVMLRLYSLAINDSKQFNKKYNLGTLESILETAERSSFMNSGVIEIYCHAIRLDTTSHNDETFYKLKDMLRKYSKDMESEESFRIYNCLLSYCYEMKILPGKNFEADEFELISQMLTKGLLVVENTIYPEWFMYAFLSAVRAGKLEYAEKFIKEYGQMLPAGEKGGILNHAIAELAFERRDYAASLKLLALPKYNSVNEKLRANHMYIKIYYETGNIEQFFNQVNSFKQIMRNVTTLSRETGIIPRNNFIKFTEKLFKIKIGESYMPAGEIKREIMKSKILGNKWLLDKAAELETNEERRKRR